MSKRKHRMGLQKRRWYVDWWIDEDTSGESYFEDKNEAIDFKFTIMSKNNQATARLMTVVQCCDEEMFCDSFTNVCEICGKLYNNNGDLLRPRSEWEGDY